MPLHTSCDIAIINFGGIIIKLCLAAFMIADITKAHNHLDSSIDVDNLQTDINLRNNFRNINEPEYLKFQHLLPFRVDSFQKYLIELKIQEKRNIRKKKSVKRNDKKIQANVMRNRIKDLMSNITRTLNDVDWYLSYEELVSEKNREKECSESEPTQKLLIKRMKEVDQDTSDLFVDSFVQQMYELDPSILDKINDRIDSEFSIDTEPSIDRGELLREARLASTAQPRRLRVSTAVKDEEDIPYVDEVQEDETLKKIPKYLKSVNRMFRKENVAKLLGGGKEVTKMKESTTTSTVSTTYENFYDYADYYRENEDDRLRDVAHYEIVQDALHSTRSVGRLHHGRSYLMERLKNKDKKARGFRKNKEMFSKILKNRLENLESKNYIDYNIDCYF